MNLQELAQRDVVMGEDGARQVPESEWAEWLSVLGDQWQVSDERLRRSIDFPDFKSALSYLNKVGELAEAHQHHPDLHLSWGKVGIELWTHACNGLTESDFGMAAKFEVAL